MKKLSVFVFIIVLASLLVFTAAGGREGSSSAGGGGISGPLVLWHHNDAVAAALIEGFNAIYPDVVIEHSRSGGSGIYGRIVLAAPAGTGPDVLIYGHADVSRLVSDGMLEPLPRTLQARFEDLITESAMATATLDGIAYGLPFQVDNIGLFYNKDLVSRPPETFEEIFEFARRWNNPANGQYALRISGANFFEGYPFFSAFGYSIFGPNNDDWRNPGFDSPEMARGLAFYASLRQIFDFPSQDADTEATVGAFRRGIVPFIITGPWNLVSIINSGVNFGVTKIPTINGVQPYAFAGSRVASVSSYAKNFDAAFAFLEFMASEEAALIYYQHGAGVAPLKNISNIAGIRDDEYIQGLLQQTPYTIPTPIIPEINIFWAPAQEMLTFLWDGQLTIPQAQARAMESYELLLNGMGRSVRD